MAYKPNIQCPLCNDELSPETRLEDHLVDGHSKRELAKYVVTEGAFLDGPDASD